jgi:hypothetical protein
MCVRDVLVQGVGAITSVQSVKALIAQLQQESVFDVRACV